MKYGVQLTRNKDIVAITDTKKEASRIAVEFLKNELGTPYVNSGIGWFLTHLPNDYKKEEDCYEAFISGEESIDIVNILD